MYTFNYIRTYNYISRNLYIYIYTFAIKLFQALPTTEARAPPVLSLIIYGLYKLPAYNLS